MPPDPDDDIILAQGAGNRFDPSASSAWSDVPRYLGGTTASMEATPRILDRELHRSIFGANSNIK